MINYLHRAAEFPATQTENRADFSAIEKLSNDDFTEEMSFSEMWCRSFWPI